MIFYILFKNNNFRLKCTKLQISEQPDKQIETSDFYHKLEWKCAIFFAFCFKNKHFNLKLIENYFFLNESDNIA